MREGRVRHWAIAASLLALGWSIRLLFVYATPDASWEYSFGFKGDSLVYLAQGAALLSQPEQFELGLPLRPPATGYLIALLGTEDIAVLRHVWIAMGAALAPIVYWTVRATLTDRVALFAATFTAIASGPLLLSSAVSSETPYLLLSTLSVGVLPMLRERESKRTLLLGAWSALQALTCLFRAEHVLFSIIGIWWAVRGREKALLSAAFATTAFVAAALPWQIHVFRTVDRYNTTERSPVQKSLDWTPDAEALLDGIPAFARASSVGFIEDTVRIRGRRNVTAMDIDILREAYDYIPEPLSPWSFVALYGPLNFYLANHEAAKDGFSRQPLFEPPPLIGGPQRYPRGLLGVLPRDLELSYPPHLKALNEGYAMGVSTIAHDPIGWLGRAREKLMRTWAGAAHGIGGYALPVGMSGVRRNVDLVTPSGTWATVFRGLLLVAFLMGMWEAFLVPRARPWLLWILARGVIVVAFFGYARQGALLTPAIGVLLGLVFERYWSAKLLRTGVAILAAVIALDAYRFFSPPEIRVDGVVIDQTDPFRSSHEDRQIVVDPWK